VLPLVLQWLQLLQGKGVFTHCDLYELWYQY
jgi:hypothetical protein